MAGPQYQNDRGRPASERPQPSFVETPEFKEAVASAAAEAVAAALAELKPPAPATPSDPGYQAFSESLALAIAQLTDQGSAPKHVAPEIIRGRNEARKEMERLIDQACETGLRATYRLINKVHFSDRLIEPLWVNAATHAAESTVIEWQGVPNEAMEPVSDTAKAIHAAFMRSIGNRSIGGVDERDKRITPGGVVIHSGSQGAAFGRPLPDPARGPMVNVMHESGPGQYRKSNVLGSILPPVMGAS